MLSVNERVARYLAATPPAISGNHGHDQTFKVACDLVHGWALPPFCALALLRIYNERCRPRWALEELRHKIDDAVNADHGKLRGHLLGVNGGSSGESQSGGKSAFVRVAPKFDREAFRRFIADQAPGAVDAQWLRERSPIDPASQTPANFLGALFEKDERILIFDAVCSRGSAIWTHPGALVCNGPAPSSLDRFTTGARSGIWFLANPIDGVWQTNAAGRWSLRRQGNITSFRYLVLESDICEEEWLAFLAALALPIAAIVETGHRLAHALIRIDAKSKKDWDRIRDALAPLLVRGGADPGSLSAVRLTRLPGCERLGRHDGDGVYQPFGDGPYLQRLLYLDPRPTCVPIARAGLQNPPQRV